MITAVDNAQVFWNLSVETHERTSPLTTRAFGGLNFSSLQRILTSGSCESTSLLFAHSNLFGGSLHFESTTYLTKLNAFGG
jgi:hypothetical protein